MLQNPASRVGLSRSPCLEGRGHKQCRLFPSLSQILRNWQSLTRRTPEISRRTPRLTGKLLALGKKTQRTPGSTDSEKLTSCSQKPKHSTSQTQSARNTEFFDVTRRLINKIAPRQTGWMSLLRQPVGASNFSIRTLNVSNTIISWDVRACAHVCMHTHMCVHMCICVCVHVCVCRNICFAALPV